MKARSLRLDSKTEQVSNTFVVAVRDAECFSRACGNQGESQVQALLPNIDYLGLYIVHDVFMLVFYCLLLEIQIANALKGS